MAAPLRIAFATQEYVTETNFDGGIANYVHRTAKALARMGHDVHVVTLSSINRAEFVHEGVNVHRVAFGNVWRGLNYLTRYRLTTSYYALGLSAKVHRKLKQLHAHRPFDIFQFPNCSCCGLFSIMFLRVPHVLRASWSQSVWQAADQVKPNLDFKLLALLERIQYRRSPNIFAPSSTLQKILAAEAGLEQIQIIPTPFYMETKDQDDSVYERTVKRKKYLLFFGRFELRKGFHILLPALSQFLGLYPNANVVLVGRDMKTALAPSMRKYAESKLEPYRDRVLIINELSHAQLYPIITGAHLVVLPSLVDNLPNACLEAMALGKAVIGTADASFDELITENETGFLVPANDVAALADKIVAAWTHPRLEEIGREAKLRAADFSPEITVKALDAYYRQVLFKSNAKEAEHRPWLGSRQT